MKSINKNNLKPFLLTIFALCALFASNAFAYSTGWSTASAACTPSDNTGAKLAQSSGFGTVSFKPTAVGSAYLTCAIPGLFRNPPAGTVPTLTLNYYDGDGTGSTCQVRAHLLRGNSEGLERGSDIIAFNSNLNTWQTETGTNKSVGGIALPEPLNTTSFNTSVYWVQLELNRLNTSCNIVSTSVSITYQLVLL